jgi:preprotein translocase subunit SecE
VAAKKTIKRIKLSGGKAIVEDGAETAAKNSSSEAKPSRNSIKRPAAKNLLLPVSGPFGYFKGSWQELRQVRWPSRRSTWGLTLAVILFTLFFVLVILLLDAAFQFLFKEVLLK